MKSVSLPMGAKRRPRAAAFALLVAVLATGAACSSDRDEGAPVGPPTTAPPNYPLTGLPATNPANVRRPALNIKIDNVPAARPQAGVDAADVVYEEIVEGGLTRLMAVYQSTDSDDIGPVRSVRPTDPALAAPFGGVFGFSGGSERFDALIREVAGLTAVSPGDDGSAFVEHGPHTGDHTTYTWTAALYAKAPPDAGPPPAFSPFLPVGQPFAPAGAAPATGIRLVVGTQPVGFDFDAASKTWLRTNRGSPDLLQNGTQVSASNVIVQYVPYEPVAGATDTTGAQVYEARVVGTGEALILSDGKVLNGRWSKSSPSAMTTYTDAAGAPVALTPGRTWVELPEPGAATTVT